MNFNEASAKSSEEPIRTIVYNIANLSKENRDILIKDLTKAFNKHGLFGVAAYANEYNIESKVNPNPSLIVDKTISEILPAGSMTSDNDLNPASIYREDAMPKVAMDQQDYNTNQMVMPTPSVETKTLILEKQPEIRNNNAGNGMWGNTEDIKHITSGQTL